MLLRQIQHFQAIVEEGSFTEAAERCHISQSGISQSVKALEDELGVELFIRKHRSFTLTEAGAYFYRKSLVITADLDQLCRETARIAHKDSASLSLGCLITYSGGDFTRAVSAFAERYPAVALTMVGGNHEDLYEGLKSGKLDLVLNDQRRAFSGVYENRVLSDTLCYVEMASYNPLAKLPSIGVEDLKNTPCLLVASPEQEEEERAYYRDVIGFQSEFLFVKTMQDASVQVLANRGFMPVDGVEADTPLSAGVKRLPLTRAGEPVRRRYCAFWRKGNDNPYVKKFADILLGK